MTWFYSLVVDWILRCGRCAQKWRLINVPRSVFFLPSWATSKLLSQVSPRVDFNIPTPLEHLTRTYTFSWEFDPSTEKNRLLLGYYWLSIGQILLPDLATLRQMNMSLQKGLSDWRILHISPTTMSFSPEGYDIFGKKKIKLMDELYTLRSITCI